MFDLEGLLRSLDEHGVEFVVIGGVAVGAHGYIRATEDLDIVPAPESENYRRLSDLLEEADAHLPTAGDRRFDPDQDALALRKGRNLTAATSLGALDIVQLAAGVPPYKTLASNASRAELFGISVRICSLADLRRMKEATGRSQDLADLDNLPADEPASE